MPRSSGTIRAMRLAKTRASFRADLRGARRVKRLFRGLPDAMRDDLARVLERGGRLIVAEMQRRAPKRTQALAAGISERVLRTTLRLRAGLIGTPRGRAKLFYGRIQDLGRKAQTVTVKRHIGNRGRFLFKGRERVQDFSIYKMRVRAMAPKRFITGRFPELRRIVRDQLKGTWERALRVIGNAGD